MGLLTTDRCRHQFSYLLRLYSQQPRELPRTRAPLPPLLFLKMTFRGKEEANRFYVWKYLPINQHYVDCFTQLMDYSFEHWGSWYINKRARRCCGRVLCCCFNVEIFPRKKGDFLQRLQGTSRIP